MRWMSHVLGIEVSLARRQREDWRRRAVSGLVALLVLVSPFAMLGCNGDGDGNNNVAAPPPAPAPTSILTNATTNTLAHRIFTFPNGLSANLAARTGLPQGQAFTLRFGDFGGTPTGPVALDSGSNTASGTVTIGSCNFQFTQSNFPARQGPQAGTQFIADPCQIDTTTGALILTDAQTGETATSSASDASTLPSVAFVLTTDFSTGSYSVVDLTTRNVTKDIKRGGVHSDAIARVFGGRIYVVNRLGVDSIQIIDPQLAFTTPTNGELSVGNGSNPQDIVFVNATKAYVSRLGSPKLAIINPTTLRSTGELDLSRLIKPADTDGSPEPAYMLIRNGLVYLALQHIDFRQSQLPKVANGEVVVIDPSTDSIVTVIALHGKNPLSALHFSPSLNRILLSSVGDFNVLDGGIEAINPDTNTADAQFVISETTMGGDITEFVIVSRTKGFAIVSDTNFANSLMTFDPSTGQRLNRLVGPLDVFIPHLAINSRNEVYLAVADARTPSPGLRIFDTVTDREITTTPLNVGQLPPVFTVFIE